MRSSRLAILAAVITVACSPIPDESLGREPVLKLKGRVDVSKLRTSDKPLFVTLAWGATAEYPAICLEKGVQNPGLAAACGSPFAFAVTQPFAGQPLVVDEDGVFIYTLQSLPEARLTVGTQVGRVGYGSFIVYEDLVASGAFIPGAKSATEPMSRVLAASFTSLLLPQHRVVLREGAWGAAPFFHPFLGACEPPQGFSSLIASFSVGSDGSFSGTCETLPASEPVALLPLSEADAKLTECPQAQVHEFDPTDTPPPPPEATCLDAETMVQPLTEYYCPAATVIRLKGCWDPRNSCETPDWDLTANPPDWWSCQ